MHTKPASSLLQLATSLQIDPYWLWLVAVIIKQASYLETARATGRPAAPSSRDVSGGGGGS